MMTKRMSRSPTTLPRTDRRFEYEIAYGAPPSSASGWQSSSRRRDLAARAHGWRPTADGRKRMATSCGGRCPCPVARPCGSTSTSRSSLRIPHPQGRVSFARHPEPGLVLLRLVDDSEQVEIAAAGSATIGAFIVEPVSVSAGMLPPPAAYFAKMKSVLDRQACSCWWMRS